MAENVGPDIIRDTALEQRMLEAVVADRNAQPRSQQLQVGPSQIGGCRELLRAGLFESDTLAEPETTWAAAAHVGQTMGAELERVFGERLSAVTQQRLTATFGMLGVQISGSSDLIFVDEDQISDLKSSDDIGSVLYDLKRNASIIETLLQIRREGQLFQKNIETPDGGYELTEVMVSKLAKLHYYVQVAIYVIGAMQQGVLTENGTARLVFYDRSGDYQGFVALVVPQEQIDLFYDIGQMRLEQVVHAQTVYEQTGGNPAVISDLRDMAPSFCFSPKVMCPRRMHCWAGSDWANDNRITNADHVAAVNRYIVGRDLEKLGKGMKQSARADLKDVTGMLPDGKMVTWGGNGAINVVETTVQAPQAQARLDEFVSVPDVVAEATAEQERKVAGVDDAAAATRAMRERDLGKMQKPELVALCNAAGLEPKGVKATLVGRILDYEAEHGEIIVAAPAVDGVYVTDQPAGSTAVLAADEEMTEFAGQVAERIAEVDALAESAMQGGPEGDEAADQLQARAEERDPRIDRVQFVDTDPRPMDEPAGIEVETAQPDPDLTPAWTGAPQHPGSVRLETQKAGYEEVDAMRRRQELFGLTLDELTAIASSRGLATNVPRQFMIQAIIDAEFTPAAGRGWQPNGAGTSGDEKTDRLRQMQYDADPAMRRNYEEENR